MIVALLAALSALSARAACPTPLSAVDVRARASSMVELLEEDLGAVLRARAQEEALLADVACLRDPLSAEDVTSLLYARGLVLFFAGETRRAEAHFAAVKALDPARAPPAALAPHDGHPLAVRWAAARASGRIAPLPRPPDGVWFVDGQPSGVAPADEPYLVQRIGPDGAVAESRWVEPGDVPLPELVPAPEIRPARAPVRWATPTGLALVGAGGGTALLVGLGRGRWCAGPDENDDGYADCGAPLVGAFWGGIGASAIGAVLAATGIAGPRDESPVTLGPLPGAAGVSVEIAWGGSR